MTPTLTIAPVRKSLRVNASQERAFEVFAGGIGRWWPKGKGIGSSKLKDLKIEPRLGGRVYEIDEDDSEVTWGRVLVWSPHQRLVLSWQISASWKPDANPDASVHSEVEVRFTPEGADTTLVELEHRNFERMGAEAGTTMRNSVDGGWPGMLDHYAAAVAPAARTAGSQTHLTL